MTLRDKLKFWILLSSYIEMIVRGTSPLSLPNAIADSLAYLKAFGGTEQRNLPDGYTQLEYIESTGTQYIDTKYPVKDTVSIKIQFMRLNDSNAASLFGYRFVSSGTAAGNMRFVFVYADGRIGLRTGVNAGNSTQKILPNQKYTVEYTLGEVDVDGSLWASSSNSYSTSDFGNGYIFNTNTTGYYSTDIKKFIGRIYAFEERDNGVLVRDFVPAIAPNAEVGLYDKISGQFFTNAGTGDFVDGPVVSAPTPTHPIDLVCNNGTLKARHTSGLPLGYTLLDYIESTGTQYIDTGLAGNNNYTIKSKFYDFGSGVCVVSGSDSRYGTNYIGRVGGSGAYYRFLLSNKKSQDITASSGLHELILSPQKITFDSVDYSWLSDSNSIGQHLYLFYGYYATELKGALRLYYYQVSLDGVLLRNFIPCKNASNVVGMYDTVSGQFFTNAGTGTFTAGSAVSDPVEIYADGTVETIKDSLNNTATAEMLLKVGTYQDVQSIIDGVVTRNVGVKVFDGTETWNVAVSSHDGVSRNNFYTMFNDAISTGTDTIACSIAYWAQTAVADYSAPVCRISSAKNFNIVPYEDTTTIPDVAAWTNWLRAQYNAGHPVIVIYPLATPTTESVAGQTMQVQQGDNIVEITQASLDNLEIEGKYKKQA